LAPAAATAAPGAVPCAMATGWPELMTCFAVVYGAFAFTTKTPWYS
jgi:hypothetical protein